LSIKERIRGRKKKIGQEKKKRRNSSGGGESRPQNGKGRAAEQSPVRREKRNGHLGIGTKKKGRKVQAKKNGEHTRVELTSAERGRE